jgi:DivIVA domain-containing protein
MVTDEDILLKKFKNAGFARSGYDKDDVDDFLDEVAETVRELNKRNVTLEESKGVVPESEIVKKLKSEKTSLEQKVDDLEKFVKTDKSNKKDVDLVKVKEDEINAKTKEITSLKTRISDLENELNNVKKKDFGQKEISKKELASIKDDSNNVESATNMLSLAQKLHDEYINNAKAEAKKLIDDANTESNKKIADAKYEANKLISETEASIEKSKKKYEEEKVIFNSERSEILQKIEHLKSFENDYRTRLKKQLESILTNMKNNFE